MPKEKICGIYCIENMINGKKYIGKSLDVYKRMKNLHKKSTVLYNAIKKYGKENFDYYVAECCTPEEMSEREQYYIAFLATKVPGGYNLTDGGEGNLGYFPSAETREKMSIARLGITLSEETKKKMSDSRKGILYSEDTIEKMRQAKLGIPYSEERRTVAIQRMSGDNAIRLGQKSKNAVSKYFGVYKDVNQKNKTYQYWRTIVKINGKNVSVGNHPTELDAAKAYNEYVIKNGLNKPLNNIDFNFSGGAND